MAEDINQSLGLAGAGFRFDACGVEWTLLPLTQRHKAEFVAWVKKLVLKTALDARKDLTRDEFRELLSATNADIASGIYEWMQPGCAKFSQTEDGVLKLLSLLLSDRHPAMTVGQARELMEDNPDAVSEGMKWAVSPNPSLPAGKAAPAA